MSHKRCPACGGYRSSQAGGLFCQACGILERSNIVGPALQTETIEKLQGQVDREARDAEHRAELDQCQTDLKSARHSLLQSDNQVARLVAENERLRGELGEAKRLLARIDDVDGPWMPDVRRFLAVPSPTTPTSCTASAGSCNSPNACGESGKCIDARMREFVAPTQSTPMLCEQHGREDCPRPDHAVPPDDIRERPAVVYATQAQLDQRMRVVSERLERAGGQGRTGDARERSQAVSNADDGPTWCPTCLKERIYTASCEHMKPAPQPAPSGDEAAYPDGEPRPGRQLNEERLLSATPVRPSGDEAKVREIAKRWAMIADYKRVFRAVRDGYAAGKADGGAGDPEHDNYEGDDS